MFNREDDMLAQQIELVGPFPVDFCMNGTKSQHFFRPDGTLQRCSTKPWPLLDVMVNKYKMPREKAQPFVDFMCVSFSNQGLRLEQAS